VPSKMNPRPAMPSSPWRYLIASWTWTPAMIDAVVGLRVEVCDPRVAAEPAEPHELGNGTQGPDFRSGFGIFRVEVHV